MSPEPLVEAGGAGQGDVVVDGNVAKEIVVVVLADDDFVAVLDDGRVVDDLLDARVDVAAATHPAVARVEMGDYVDLVT
jgi:hypothetical protein